MTTFGDDLIKAMEEALAHARGEAGDGTVEHIVDISNVDPKKVRKNLRLTQDKMAFVMGMSSSGYKKWEQGGRNPGGAARTLLHVMDKEPEAVIRALTATEVEKTSSRKRPARHRDRSVVA